MLISTWPNVNKGCSNEVIVRDWKYYSFKHLCSNCTHRLQKGLPSRKGVTSYKKNYCENKDGRLGFKCTSTIMDPCQIDMDHKDGNNFDLQHLLHHQNIQKLQNPCNF